MSLFNRIASGLVLPAFLLMTVGMLTVVGCDDDGAAEEGATADTTAGAAESGFGVNGRFASVEEWGENLVTTLGCNDCHSAKKPGPQGPVLDESMMLAGHPADQALAAHDPALIGMGPNNWILANNSFTAYVGPWGTSYAANLTPDPTGLGSWTEEQFLAALKQGWYKGMEGTRKLLPPMPWQGYSELSDEEARAIFAYLKTVPPVENAVPAPIMAGPPPAAATGEAPAGDSTVDTGA